MAGKKQERGEKRGPEGRKVKKERETNCVSLDGSKL